MIKREGSILIFILWVLIALAVFGIAISFRASGDAKLAKYESDKIKAAYLARAGIMKMLSEILKDTDSYDSLNEDWNRDEDDPKILYIGKDKVLYGASDESARLNLNSRSLKKEQLVVLGLNDKLAEGIIGYRNRKADKGLEFPEELFLVEDMTREIYAGIKDYVTICRGDDPTVNINTAGPLVLGTVLLNQDLVRDILEYRKGPDGKEGTGDDGIFRQESDMLTIKGIDRGLFSVRSHVFRILAQSFIAEDKEASVNAEAVIDRSGKVYNLKES